MKNISTKHLKIRKTVFFTILFILAISLQQSIGQNVGITNGASITPYSLLHVHTTAAGGAGNFFQLSNATTGSSATDGFAIDIDASMRVMFKNLETSTATSGFSFYANSIERMRIGFAASGTSEVWVNLVSPYSGDVFSATSNTEGEYAVNGYNTSATATIGGGVYGSTWSEGSFGIWGVSKNASGTGVVGSGNNQTSSSLVGGSGGAFSGTSAGVAVWATTVATSTAVMGAANNVGIYTLTGTGSGGGFSGTYCGVYGNATATAGDRFGAYFVAGASVYSYIAERLNTTNYAIYSNGTKSTIVKDLKGKNVTMFCTETPEVLFQDYGRGKLIDGKCHIEIDSIFAKNIQTDDKHQLKIFVQLEGDCNGVYVTNKAKDGFDVVELNNGKSSVDFTWTVIGNRADEYNDDGTLFSKYFNLRFPHGPGKLDETKQETKKVIKGK